MKPSCTKSFGVVRSQTRYHFVYGIVLPAVAARVECAAAPDGVSGEIDAGSGAGAPAKSAKSARLQGVSYAATRKKVTALNKYRLPGSSVRDGAADETVSFAPKRLFKRPAIFQDPIEATTTRKQAGGYEEMEEAER